MPKKYITFIITLLALWQLGQANGILELRTNYFYNFETYYISDFDFNNGRNNPDMFSYSLSYTPTGPDDPGIRIKIEFEMIADVPVLGLQNDRIFFVRTAPFLFNGRVTLTSRDIDLNLDNIYYETGAPVLGISVEESETISSTTMNAIQQSIMASGSLPVGNYIFNLSILSAEGARLLSESQTISVSNPIDLELIFPGGEAGEDIEIYTKFPVFQWETSQIMWNEDYCPTCGYAIRIAEYNPGPPKNHSSLQEALNDQASWPWPDNGQYARTQIRKIASFGSTELYTANHSFRYPIQAKPLEAGKQYVWQVKKIYPTTHPQPDQVLSDIFQFKIHGEESSGGGTTGASPSQLLQIIEQIIGSDVFGQLFEGQLAGYSPTGQILLNDTQTLTLDQVAELVNRLVAGQITITGVSIQ